MVSKQEQFFLDFLTQFFYLSDKKIIEEQFDKIEDPQVLKQREKLLKQASTKAKKSAKKAVNEFKKQNKGFVTDDYSSVEEFAKQIQDDILNS